MRELGATGSRAVPTPRPTEVRGERFPEEESHAGFPERSSGLRSRDRVSPKRQPSRINVWTLLSSHLLIYFQNSP